VVECLLAKEDVASSSLVFRSINHRRRCQVVKAGVCKTPIQRFESARRLQFKQAGMAELADAEDLKSSGVTTLWVRDPLPADSVSAASLHFPHTKTTPCLPLLSALLFNNPHNYLSRNIFSFDIPIRWKLIDEQNCYLCPSPG
jgi:hypothetical protein